MSGSNTPLSLAEQLKQTADSKHEGKISREVESIVGLVISKAEKAAKDGSYSVEHYDERLGSSDIDNAVKKILREQGFKAEVAKDSHYSEHVGKTMIFVRVSWK